MSVFLSIQSANLAHLPYRRADGRPAGLDVGDDERRPVSMLSVASAIGLPYQTARGRLPVLESKGLVRRTAAGMVTPAEALATPPMLALQQGDRDALAQVIAALLAVGYPLPGRLTVSKMERLPPALAARLLLDFTLRSMERLVRMHGDIVNGTIVAAVISANIRHLMADPDFAQRYADHDQPPPDSLRRPIPLRQLAREIDLPFETVRRRVHALEAAGEIVALPAGLIVPAATLAQSRFRDSNALIARHFRQIIGVIARLPI